MICLSSAGNLARREVVIDRQSARMHCVTAYCFDTRSISYTTMYCHTSCAIEVLESEYQADCMAYELLLTTDASRQQTSSFHGKS